MKTFRNLFRSKKDEKTKESVSCKKENNHIQFQQHSKRSFNDDMSLMKPAAAYYGEIRPSTRRPLRSCPGAVISTSRNRCESDSEDEFLPSKFEKRQRIKPNSINVNGVERKLMKDLRFEKTSEYGSGEHSPISNVLKIGHDDDYFLKYRNYKQKAQEYHQQNKKLHTRIRELEDKLKDAKMSYKDLSQKYNNLHIQMLNTNMRSYNFAQPQYPGYYSQPQYCPQPAMIPPHAPRLMSYSQAPTLAMDGEEVDEVKNFRRQDTDSKPMSSCSSTSCIGNNSLYRIESNTFLEQQENLSPQHFSFDESK